MGFKTQDAERPRALAIRDETDPISRECKNVKNSVDAAVLVRISGLNTYDLEGSDAFKYTLNAAKNETESLDSPAPPNISEETGHNTEADFDADKYMNRPGDVLLVVVQLEGQGVEFPDEEGITIDKRPQNGMFCIYKSDGDRIGKKKRRFYVEYRENVGQDNNIGSYYIWYEKNGKLAPQVVDPNIKNTG